MIHYGQAESVKRPLTKLRPGWCNKPPQLQFYVLMTFSGVGKNDTTTTFSALFQNTINILQVYIYVYYIYYKLLAGKPRQMTYTMTQLRSL